MSAHINGDVRGYYTALGVDLPDRGGANVMVRCPFRPDAHSHGDRNPSCSVSVESGVFNCFACRVQGGPYDAAVALGREPRDAMDLLRRHGLAEDRENGHSTARSSQPTKGARTPHKAAENAGQGVSGLQFVSAAELRDATPADPPWVWSGYLARGSVTLLAGKPKAGKSTLAWALAGAIVSGSADFLGRRLEQPGPVVYISEEGAGTLVHKVPALDGLRVLTRDGAWPRPTWGELVEAAVREALRVEATLLVIDTFAYWSDLPAEREKDAGAVQDAMGALVGAVRDGLAVLLVHHQRKAGGEDGDAIRGSSAIAGAADALVEIERPPAEAEPTHRQLVAIGRWPDTPALMLVDRDPATQGWRRIGEGAGRADAGRLAWPDRLLATLSQDEPGVTYDDLESLLDVKKPKWHAALDDLIADGQAIRTGEGKKGSPYRFREAPEVSVLGNRPPARTETEIGPPRNRPVDAVVPRRGTASGTETYEKPSRPTRTETQAPLAAAADPPPEDPEEREVEHARIREQGITPGEWL